MAREIFVKPSKVTTVLLAGGRSSRMGKGDKALLPWDGSTLLGTVQRRLGNNGADMVVSANHNLDSMEQYGLPVIADGYGDYAGPLAGILAAMDWVKAHRPEAQYILACSCDTPFVPPDLLERLADIGCLGTEGSMPLLVFPYSNRRPHPLHGLWSVTLREGLAAYLEGGGRRVQQFAGVHSPVAVEFGPVGEGGWGTVDPFANINSPEDYVFYRKLLQG